MKDLDSAILKYLEDFNPEKLDSLISSPSLIIDSNFLAEDHKLKHEAIIILDSLTSYNNSISNIDREEELLAIPESSPLYSWRSGVLAIYEFYNQNHLKVTEYLNEIRENSPVKKLTVFLTKGKTTALFDSNTNLNSSVDALKEVIENSMVDLYENCVKLLLDDLKSSNSNNEDIILTIIEESVDNIPLEIIHKAIINSISISESTRLMALGTMFKYPTKGIEYLFSYFTLVEFDSATDLNLRALITIILDLVKALIKEKYKFKTLEEKNSFKNDSNLFIEQLKKYYTISYKESPNPLTNLRRALDITPLDTIKKDNSTSDTQRELF